MDMEKKAAELFDERPDHIVFMAVPSACGHAGLVDDGLRYFESAGDYKVTPDQDIYGCVVDLLRRAGRVEEADELIESMPFKPDESVWGALLGACKAHVRASTFGKGGCSEDISVDAEFGGTYVMLSNIYAAEGNGGVRKYEEDDETKLFFNPANLHPLKY